MNPSQQRGGFWSGAETAAGDRQLAVLDRVASGDLVTKGWRRAERSEPRRQPAPGRAPREGSHFRRKC
jgi:hypothetical protein